MSKEVTRLIKSANDTILSDSLRKKYLDLAYNELAGDKNDSLTRNFYLEISAGYYNLDHYDKSFDVSKLVLKLADEAKDTMAMAKSSYYIADSFYWQSENDSAFAYYTQAEKLYKSAGELEFLGEIILYKTYLYYNAGEYVLSETEGVKALRLLLNGSDSRHIYNAYNLIALSMDGQNSSDEALKYYDLALKQLDQLKKDKVPEFEISENRASCYNNMGGVYEKMGQYDKAITLYNEALSYQKLKNESPALYAKLLNNLAYAKFKLGDYTDLPDMFFESLKIRDSLDNKSGIVASKIHIAEYYAAQNDTAKAINNLKQAYYQAKAIRSHFHILTALELLADIDKDNKDYTKKYIRVSDSVQQAAKNTRNKFARIEYETDRLLNEKEELVKRNSFIIGVATIGLLFLGAIFIIYYLNSRNKKLLLIQEQQNANEEIYHLMLEQQSKIDRAREEEKSRIAMELHDGILNNIYAVRLNLEFINKKADEESITKRKEFIKQLQIVETEIRGVSHDLSRNAIFEDKSFSDLLEQVIFSQKNDFNTVFEAVIDPEINWEAMSNIQKVNIYRIIQEGLQNINKYSQAKNAKIEISTSKNSIRTVVKDDGVGFDPEKTKNGIGIKNLKKRAAALNGQININSVPGQGAEIIVEFPIYSNN